MSFTNEIIAELYQKNPNKTCCKKAFLCGMLFSALRNGESKTYTSSFYRLEDANVAASLIDNSYQSEEKTRINEGSRGGHRVYSISFSKKSLVKVLLDVDTAQAQAAEAIGFRCGECAESFLRGVFISSGAVSLPKSGYHVELSMVNEQRADAVSRLLEEGVSKAGRIKRGERIGLYYKSNVKISDLLSYLGAYSSSFEVYNKFIERDIRNRENRATNCDTGNIRRSVGATRKQLEAIALLVEKDKLSRLDQELYKTAMLRLENDSASLTELSIMHEPPISKSGLNGRLKRIMAIAEDVRAETDNANADKN